MDGNTFVGLWDTGATKNTITRKVADLIHVDQYPSAGTIYTGEYGFTKGYHVPVTVGKFTNIMPTYV